MLIRLQYVSSYSFLIHSFIEHLVHLDSQIWYAPLTSFTPSAIPHFITLSSVPSWFPGAKFQRLAKEWRVPTRGILEIPFAAMKKRWVSLVILIACVVSETLCSVDARRGPFILLLTAPR